MKNLISEIDNNFEKFERASIDAVNDVRGKLDAKMSVFQQSYRSIVSLQAWRHEFLESHISSESIRFFLEAQNDALVSHVSARNGQWRVALQSLRAVIEGVLNCLYYMDHPVELEMWKENRHKLSFTILTNYLVSHPRMKDVADSVNGINIIISEYATLSKAVHGSAVHFRMSGDDGLLLWRFSDADVGKWQTREKAVLYGINLIMLAMFRHFLMGSEHRNLRKAISVGISSSKKKEIKEKMKVHLFN